MNQQPRFINPLVLLCILALVVVLFAGPLFSGDREALQYTDVLQLFQTEKVESFSLSGSSLVMKVRQDDGTTQKLSASIGDTEQFHQDLDELITRQYADGILLEYNYPPATTPWYKGILPYVIMLAGFLLLFVLLINRTSGGPGSMAKFTQSGARFGAPDSGEVTFRDVAGVDEEKQELMEIVDFLRDPKRYTALGAKIPKGVLLVGPPGTGKTLLAKATAGEAGVSFLSISGSDFVELYVGVGASRVRDLFEQAKRVAPTIVFIDEIDAVGRRRGAGLGGGHDEREQTLNQLLVEMDGFRHNEGIIVMAATNRQDILDPALLRPGRFDRQIYVGAPDWQGRRDILQVHSREKPLAEDVDLTAIAKATAGFTGADLANLLNEAALLAARQEAPVISMQHLEQAMIKVIAGPEKRSRVVPEHERRLTALHEAGHAVAMYRLPTQDPVHLITIIPRGQAGGMTISLPTDDQGFVSRNEMFETIVSYLGGRVAEQLHLGDISTGASNDLQRATALARDMVCKYGMSDAIGPVSYGSDSEVFIGRDYEKTKSYSEKMAGSIDEEVHTILTRAYDECRRILEENRCQLVQVADYLLENENMDAETFAAVMKGQAPVGSEEKTSE